MFLIYKEEYGAMKKLFAALVALVMLLSFAVAEETEVVDIHFTDTISEEEFAKGEYVDLAEDFASVWIPNDLFVEMDLAEVPDAYATGLELKVYKFAADEKLLLIFSSLPNDTGTFDELIDKLKADQESFSEVEEAVVNGNRAVAYKSKIDEDETLVFVSYEVSENAWLNIMAADSDNDDYMEAARTISRSVVSTAPDAEDEAELTSFNFSENVSADMQAALGVWEPFTEDFPAKVWIRDDIFVKGNVSDVPADYATGHEIGVYKYAADESLMVIFSEVPNDGGTFDGLVAAMKEDEEHFPSVQELIINGVRAVSYNYKFDDGNIMMNSTHEIADDVWLNIMFPMNDNTDFINGASVICMSVTPVK